MSDRLVSADKAKEVLKHLLYETAMNNELDIADIYEDIIENRLDTWIELIPTADTEPTEEQVKEYCRKRCLVIVDSELFNEMKARRSAEPVKHGHWEWDGYVYDMPYRCSECSCLNEYDSNYCPNCEVKMDDESMANTIINDGGATTVTNVDNVMSTFHLDFHNMNGKTSIVHGEKGEKMANTDKLVNLLNQLIEEAVEDGGDAGGAYNQNQEGLTNAINNILDYLELSDYKVVGTNDYSCWSRIKIGSKGETI